MAIFEDIELSWKGVPYRLSGDGQIMKALAAVEDHVTIAELTRGSEQGNIPIAKLSAAYAAVLRMAGARVSDSEVYLGMWQDGADASKLQEAITSLMTMMMPPQVLDSIQDDEGGKDPKAEDGSSKPTNPPSSDGE